MTTTHKIAAAIGEALSSVRAGDDTLASFQLAAARLPKLAISSPWFATGGRLPRRCTVDGEGVSPPLIWSEPPPATQSFAVICEDPDAPKLDAFVHWLVYGISAAKRSVDSSTLSEAREGKNSKHELGFTPAAPPAGHGAHHYHFQLFALDNRLTLEGGQGREELLNAMKGHVLAVGDLVGVYERQ